MYMKFLMIFLVSCVTPCNRESGENSTENERSLSSKKNSSAQQDTLPLGFDESLLRIEKVLQTEDRIVPINDTLITWIYIFFKEEKFSAYNFFLNHDINSAINKLKGLILRVDTKINLQNSAVQDISKNKSWLDNMNFLLKFIEDNNNVNKIKFFLLQGNINNEPADTLFYSGSKDDMYKQMLNYINFEGNYSEGNKEKQRIDFKNIFKRSVDIILKESNNLLKAQNNLLKILYIFQKQDLFLVLKEIRAKAEEISIQLKTYDNECDKKIEEIKNDVNMKEGKKKKTIKHYQSEKIIMRNFHESLKKLVPDLNVYN